MLDWIYGWIPIEAPGLTMCDNCHARIMPGEDSWELTNTEMGDILGEEDGELVVYWSWRRADGRRCIKCGPPYAHQVAAPRRSER